MKLRVTGTQVLDMDLSPFDGELDLEKLDELIDAVQGGPTLLLMNKIMRRKVNALMREAGQATETVSDVFGRQIPAYAGVPIGIVEDDASGNPILGFTEDGNTTSIWAVRFGLDGLHGLQTEVMSVRDLGELDSKPAFLPNSSCLRRQASMVMEVAGVSSLALG